MTLILNDISSIFAQWFVARDMGLPMKEETYVIALTRERYPGMRWETTRVMVVKKSWLMETDFPEDSKDCGWDLEYPHHHWRVQTLALMKADMEMGQEYCLTMKAVAPIK